MKIATTIGKTKKYTLTKTKKMETTNQIKNRAYKVGEFYVKNPIMSIDKGEFVYELTTNINEAFLMTDEAAKLFHKTNGEGQIRIINTLNQKL